MFRTCRVHLIALMTVAGVNGAGRAGLVDWRRDRWPPSSSSSRKVSLHGGCGATTSPKPSMLPWLTSTVRSVPRSAERLPWKRNKWNISGRRFWFEAVERRRCRRYPSRRWSHPTVDVIACWPVEHVRAGSCSAARRRRLLKRCRDASVYRTALW